MVECETASLIHNSLSHFGREYIDTFDRQKFYISFEKTHSKINRETFASAYLFICFVSQPLFYLLSAIVFLVCAVLFRRRNTDEFRPGVKEANFEKCVFN